MKHTFKKMPKEVAGHWTYGFAKQWDLAENKPMYTLGEFSFDEKGKCNGYTHMFEIFDSVDGGIEMMEKMVKDLKEYGCINEETDDETLKKDAEEELELRKKAIDRLGDMELCDLLR